MDDFTVSQNTGHVEQATGNMSAGQIDDIERRAKAQVVEAEGASKRVAAAEEKGAGPKASGNTEAKVYGDLAVEALAPGLKALSTVTDFLGARHADHTAGRDLAAAHASPLSSGNARTMEQDISAARRAPGLYRAPAEQSIYASAAAKADISTTRDSAKAKTASVTSGEDIMMRANIAETSLKEQGKDAIKSWEVKDAKIVGLAGAKHLTFGLRNSNELALQSANVARQQHSAMMHQVNQMAPGLALASGPTIRPADLLREARDQSETRTS